MNKIKINMEKFFAYYEKCATETEKNDMMDCVNQMVSWMLIDQNTYYEILHTMETIDNNGVPVE